MVFYQESGRILLLAGIAAALIFFIVPAIEMFRRPAFDIERHAISMLSLGEGGWIMKATFIASGILTLCCAAGLLTALGPGWSGYAALLLIGGFGAGLVLAGVYDAPVGLGFPAGTPIDQQPVMTREANLHGMAFMIAFGGLILACFVFALHFVLAHQQAIGLFSLVVGFALPTMIALGVTMTVAPGIAFYWASMLGWLWLAVIVLNLYEVT